MRSIVIIDRYGDEFYTPIRENHRPSFRSKNRIRPTPLQICSIRPIPSFSSPNSVSDYNLKFRSRSRTAPISTNGKVCNNGLAIDDDCCYQNVSFSELWAGPTYSNSPPPSSLPMPKFSVQRKRAMSLELPDSSDEVKLQPMAKSAPPSPTAGEIFNNVDSATKTLRRILNLDINYE